MAPLYLPIKNLVTKQNRWAHDTYLPGRKGIKELAAGSGFHITGVARHDGLTWVRSGLGHWYWYTDNFLSCGHCSSNPGFTQVRVYPGKPPNGSYGNHGPAYGDNNWDLCCWYAGGNDGLLVYWSIRHNWGSILNPQYGPPAP